MRYLLTFAVLLFSATTLTATPDDAAPHRDDIVEVAQDAGQFQTLLAAAEAAGLVATLKGDGPLTVFAPTDKAFERLPAGTVQRLLRPENRSELRALLTYHVVPGRIRARDLLQQNSARTVNGGRVPFGLRINGANVIQADVRASNGIIHVIDAVLMPMGNASPTPMAAAALDLIDRAIERGVPLFNRGDADACAAVYEVTARALLALGGDDLPRQTMRVLERGLRQMGRTHSANDRAWALRDALDEAYASLRTDRRMMATR
ncbi:MAG: fasciclin domain-containing protein [Bacteroidota bacterium]